jgi:antirestriction protein ArdC
MNAQDRSQELKGLAANLVASLAAGHSEQFDQFVATAARFHSYSAGNRLLIYAQLPTASRVAGFQRWLDLGRHVAKGGRALWIWAPCPVRKLAEDERGEEVEVTRTFFRPAAVFDVSSTLCLRCETAECEHSPVAEWAIDVADDNGALRLLMAACPYPVRLEEMPAGQQRGWTDGRILHVRSNMGVGSQVGTLCHEWAHCLLHFGDGRELMDRAQRELEAEIAAHLVSLSVGVERHSQDYLLSWTAENPTSESATKKLGLAIDRAVGAARTILAALAAVKQPEPELAAAA